MPIYTELLFRPILNLLILIYNFIPGKDLAVAILILTLLIRLILYPLNRTSIISQKKLQEVQPKLEALKEKYKGDREKLGSEMMALYKQEKINPFSSCLPLLIQLPILLAVFHVFRGLNSLNFDLLYSWVVNPGTVNTFALGFLELSKRSIPIAVLAGIAQFWQTKMLMNKRQASGGTAGMMNKQMLYMMPAVTAVIGSSLPAGLTIYWFFTTLLSGLQQLWMIRRKEIAGRS